MPKILFSVFSPLLRFVFRFYFVIQVTALKTEMPLVEEVFSLQIRLVLPAVAVEEAKYMVMTVAVREKLPILL